MCARPEIIHHMLCARSASPCANSPHTMGVVALLLFVCVRLALLMLPWRPWQTPEVKNLTPSPVSISWHVQTTTILVHAGLQVLEDKARVSSSNRRLPMSFSALRVQRATSVHMDQRSQARQPAANTKWGEVSVLERWERWGGHTHESSEKGKCMKIQQKERAERVGPRTGCCGASPRTKQGGETVCVWPRT
jgi:hypothetical protein